MKLISLWRRLVGGATFEPRKDAVDSSVKNNNTKVNNQGNPREKKVPQDNAETTNIASEQGQSGLSVSAAVRTGQAKLAHSKLLRWRDRYLGARRQVVQLALSRLSDKHCSSDERKALTMLLEDTEAEAVTASLAAKAGRSLQLSGAASFRQSLTMRSRRAQLAGAGPEWRLNDKIRGARFAKNQGLPCTEIYQRGISKAELSFRTGSVIKPSSGAGSRGVYLILGDGSIFEPGRNAWHANESALERAMGEDLVSGRVSQDSWLSEQLITEDASGMQPGCDLKFYCFHGHVGLVLEVQRREQTEYCEWDRDGNRIDTGKYTDKVFDGQGANAEQIKVVEKVSCNIPSPFIRIDFIRCASSPIGMVFCEFTPRPGNYHRFDRKTDQRLGDLYLSAEAALEKTLMSGKAFHKMFSS